MKTIILMIAMALSFTGCLKDFFAVTAKPDAITKSIVDKYNIQYLNKDKKAKEWLSNSMSKNFFIHIEIDKNGNYEEVKKAILHAYDKSNRKELEKYYINNVTSYEKNLREEKSISNLS